MVGPARPRPGIYDEGNKRFRLVELRSIVADPQFRSGYRDRLAGRPPKPFFHDDAVKGGDREWAYERGRLVACWLLATGRTPPKARDVEALVRAYRAAEEADVVL
jgi:hypothetical protein